MINKTTLTIEERKEKARNFLKDNGETSASFALWFSKSGAEAYTEGNAKGVFDWKQQGEYFVHLAIKGGGTHVKIEAPNGALKDLPLCLGDDGKSPLDALLGVLLEVDSQDKTLCIITVHDWLTVSVESLEKWEANDWIKPDKKEPKNLDVWKLIAKELKDKNILLYSARTKDDVLKLSKPKPTKRATKRKPIAEIRCEVNTDPFIVDSLPSEWGEVSGGLYAI